MKKIILMVFFMMILSMSAFAMGSRDSNEIANVNCVASVSKAALSKYPWYFNPDGTPNDPENQKLYFQESELGNHDCSCKWIPNRMPAGVCKK